MSSALVLLPNDAPPDALETAFAAVDGGMVARVAIDGIGAVVDAPDDVVDALAALPEVAAATTGPVPLAGLAVGPAAQPWLEAWNKRVDPAYRDALAGRDDEWLVDGAVDCRGALAAPAPPPKMTLVGDIAAGMIFVDGPAGSAAKMSATDVADLTLSVLHGFDILYANAPASAHLVFLVEPQTARIAVDPATMPPPLANPAAGSAADYEDREARWRDPALLAMGLPTGLPGIDKYRTQLWRVHG